VIEFETQVNQIFSDGCSSYEYLSALHSPCNCKNLNVTVQVQTFEGAHNPPYGEETITFQINGSQIKVVDYKHRDVPKEEWTKIELRNSYKKTNQE
jgi:hypothetical protein